MRLLESILFGDIAKLEIQTEHNINKTWIMKLQPETYPVVGGM